jgi:hypothetical protein
MSDAKNGPAGPDDVPISDAQWRKRWDDCSTMKIKRARARGAPGPHFRIGQTPFTWLSAIVAWETAQSAEYRLDGKRPPRSPSSEAAA